MAHFQRFSHVVAPNPAGANIVPKSHAEFARDPSIVASARVPEAWNGEISRLDGGKFCHQS